MRTISSGLAMACLCAPFAAVAQRPAGPDMPDSPIIERNKLVVSKFYPPTSIRRGEEGTVKFAIVVGRDGKLDGCQVTNSSGYAALDKATCDMMLSGATGQVRRYDDKRRMAYTREGLVEWSLPDGVARPATPPPFDVTRSASGEPLICKRQTKTGSNFITEKVCLTRADWQRQQAFAQEETQKMQTPRGGPLPF